MRTFLGLVVLGMTAIPLSGCGIITTEFDGTVSIDAFITSDPDENFFKGCVGFDPNEDEDYRENKDRLDGGIIRAVFIEITDINPPDSGSDTPHEANFGVGEIDIRRNADPSNPDPTCDQELEERPFIEAAARWDPVRLAPGVRFPVELDQSVLKEVHRLIFDEQAPLEVRFVGIADEQVNFAFEAEFDLEFGVRVP